MNVEKTKNGIFFKVNFPQHVVVLFDDYFICLICLFKKVTIYGSKPNGRFV
jgi:hypothetical protein